MGPAVGARDGDPAGPTTPALEIRDLRFTYPGEERPALDGVGCRIRRGERVALLGANGAGKSTLLLHLNGLLLPERGRVTVEGVPVEEPTLRDVRSRVGLVFQDPDDQLFLPTLLEDVAFAPLNAGRSPAEAEARARAALRSLGLEAAADRAAHHLSGGEQRLGALATVLVSRPSILALDEPTGSLDAASRRRVVRILTRREETLLIATHDLEVAAALCRRGIVLAGGRVVADAPLPELLRDERALLAHGLRAPLDEGD